MADERDLGRFLIEALVDVVGGLAGGTPSQTPAAAPSGPQWTLTFASEGSLRGACTVVINHAGAAALAKVAVGQDSDTAIESVLRDAVAEVVSALLGNEDTSGIQLTLREVAKSPAAPAGNALSAASLTAEGLSTPLQVGYYASLEAVAGSKRRPSQAEPMADERQARLDVILDIDLPVVVRFGRTEMPLRAVTRIAPGSIIDLGRSPDDPVELLVSDRVVARGEVVVVGGNYGIRIVDVVSPSERMRSMES
jgi:flagellar motor switch protein FliN/FliY